jgi:hypothetical protein
MKTKYFAKINILLGFLLLIIFAAGCKKEDDEEGVSPRLFRPYLTVNEDVDNQLALSWIPIKGAISYKVEISRDSFATIDQSADVNMDVLSYAFTNLLGAQFYYMRVLAVSSDPVQNSKFAEITGTTPSIMKKPDPNDILDITLKARWTKRGAPVTSLTVLSANNDSLISEIPITDNSSLDSVLVTGLKGSMTYSLLIYSGESMRGRINYTTKPSLEGNVIDLRAVPFRPSILYDTLIQISSGSIIILKRGLTYEFASSFSLDKSITILSGYDFIKQPATISFSNNFNAAAGATVDSVILKDLNLIGSDYATKYVFNINTASTFGKIKFESCRASIFRGLCRLQAAAITISEVSINNCIIDSIDGYGVVNVDNNLCSINNISITKSTIYNSQLLVVSRSNSNTVRIEDCTFDNAPAATRYIVNYSTSPTNNVTNGVFFKNCIFGKSKYTGTNNLVRAYQLSAATSVDVQNTYVVTDFNQDPAYLLPNTTVYSNNAAALFNDPVNGNFSFKDTRFSGASTAGDPRWRK